MKTKFIKQMSPPKKKKKKKKKKFLEETEIKTKKTKLQQNVG